MKNFSQFLIEAKEKSIFVFDLDDTILKTVSKIRYKEPGKDWKEIATNKFSEIRFNLNKNTEFDYSDFEDVGKTIVALKTAKFNKKTLKLIDDCIINNIPIGILTARDNSDVIYDNIRDILLYKDKDGDLKEIPKELFQKKYVFAIGNSKLQKDLGTAKAKAHILQKEFGDKQGFTDITFVDDDENNVRVARELKDKRITAKVA